MSDRENRCQPFFSSIQTDQHESCYNSKWGLNQLLMFQLLQFQKLVNIELLRNQDAIESYLSLKRQESGSKNGQSGISSTSDGVDIVKNDRNGHQTIININSQAVNNRQEQQPHNNGIKKKKITNISQKAKTKQKNEDSSYDPNDKQGSKPHWAPNSESKNVPKNISKAILLFVMKKQTKLKKLMQDLNINKQQFMQQVASLKGKIHAIAQLRSLWLDSENKHAKIFRIISNYYLRKHSLQHIFNSRVIQHGKHLKYRQRILSVLRNPQMFTHMKQY